MRVDFLPESYRRARRARVRVLREIALVAGVIGVLLLATAAIKGQRHSQKLTAQRLEATLAAEQTTLGLMDELARERASLRERIKLRRELSPPVSYTQILAALGEATPEGVAVTQLSMRSVRPEPEPMGEAKANKRRSNPALNEPAPVEPDYVTVELDALAPGDMAVAQMVSGLDAHPLFSRVAMRSSRAVDVGGLGARSFSLTAEVDLDREFRWSADQGEVAHAD
ncbi:MAG: PilN domain-containing protein [Planctomycetota bacterium]